MTILNSLTDAYNNNNTENKTFKSVTLEDHMKTAISLNRMRIIIIFLERLG